MAFLNPLRVIGWSATAIVVSIAVLVGVIAATFLLGLIEAVVR